MPHAQLHATPLVALLLLWGGAQVSALETRDRARTQLQRREADQWVPIHVDSNLTAFSEYMKSLTANRRLISDKEEVLLSSILRDLFHHDPQRYNSYFMLIQTLMEFPPGDGLVLEFGVNDAFSANITARLLRPGLQLAGFDTFEGLPEAFGGILPQGHFSQHGVIPPHEPNSLMYKGFFNATLGQVLSNRTGEGLAFANMDCDLYAGTKDVLHELKDRMRPGSIMHFHELMGPRPEENELAAFHEFVINGKPDLGWEMYNVTGIDHQPVVLRAVDLHPAVASGKKGKHANNKKKKHTR